MDITIVVAVAAVMAIPITIVDAPTLMIVGVLILTPVDALTVTVTMIKLVKMMIN
jgi:hypothetical protein